jgi:predicted membrane-bound dolichyl-phosphate-mannose-protein mannosyltransferase
MLTPFSGLSLVIHLAVICFALMFKRSGAAAGRVTTRQILKHKTFKHVLSICILIVVSSFMLLSFAIAVKTGFREGMNEPHMIYVRQGLENVVGVGEVNARSNNLDKK